MLPCVQKRAFVRQMVATTSIRHPPAVPAPNGTQSDIGTRVRMLMSKNCNVPFFHYHLKSGHSGLEHVLYLIRESFWILNARPAVKSVLRGCFDCKRRQAPLGEQQMADLPTDRVTPEKPPFTFVGVDCFGPFVVWRGRSHVKRYRVFFTRLSIRAIHLEVAHSLDTDSFINAMRRFIARRGQPEQVR